MMHGSEPPVSRYVDWEDNPEWEESLPPLSYDEPPGYEIVAWWCWRAGGHLCDTGCKSDSVPLLAQSGWATGVRGDIADEVGD
jgi:hypothetical protein